MIDKYLENRNFHIFIANKKSTGKLGRIFKLIFLILLIMGALTIINWLAGCSSTKQPYQITVDYQAVEQLNPDIEGKAAPLVVIFYQLKSPAKFQDASFFSLYQEPTTVLGKDLLDSKEIEIQPKQNLIETQDLYSETKYLGIIAGYRDITHAKWKSIIKITEGNNIIVRAILGVSGIALFLNHHQAKVQSVSRVKK